jgi:hypothetical protein
MRTIPLFAAAALLGACATARSPAPAPAVPPAPWSAPRISAGAIPAIYTQVWTRAENRAECALLAPRQLPPLSQTATPRAATFSGGWAVAYDLPETRSAFGVAGSGANAWDANVYDQWPHRVVYADSSRVGYGLEGGQGTNWLAYVRIPGQRCLYNVWSRVGREHLEQLLDHLRFVDAQ